MTAPADIDILVRRCTVRVIRHGGWSWGPQPRRLVDQVLAALPGLITEQLGDLASAEAPDMEITEPVRIVVSMPLADLLAGRFDPRQHAAVTAAPLPEPSLIPEPVPPLLALSPYRTPIPGQMPVRTASSQLLTLAKFLGRLAEHGELAPVLALLPVTTLAAWYRALAASPAEIPDTSPGTANPVPEPASSLDFHGSGTPLLEQVSESLAQSKFPALAEFLSGLAERGELASFLALLPVATLTAWHWTLAASSPETPGPASAAAIGAIVESARHQTVPKAQGSRSTAVGSTFSGTAGPTKRTTVATAIRIRPTSKSAAVTSADISSVLPFLLLGPLTQIGYLQALVPALQPAGLEAQTAAFATALAYTVLGPLERGWRRQPEDLAGAAAFAGVSAPVPGAELSDFARTGAPVLPGLDAVVTRALAEGHTPGEPLILAGGHDGFLLADREGLFPIAWSETVAGLLQVWAMSGSPPILVTPTAIDVLADLSDAGASFVVAAPPARGEHWRRLSRGLWTNDLESQALTRYAAGYQQAADLTADLIRTLAGERAAVPLADGPALGRSLLLAAGLGLGTLAWTLWREREPTDPLLPLERFADLSARVSFEPDRIRVQLPLGPRHSDLYAHGLLADVHGVPWFGGRVVEFSGG